MRSGGRSQTSSDDQQQFIVSRFLQMSRSELSISQGRCLRDVHMDLSGHWGESLRWDSQKTSRRRLAGARRFEACPQSSFHSPLSGMWNV